MKILFLFLLKASYNNIVACRLYPNFSSCVALTVAVCVIPSLSVRET